MDGFFTFLYPMVVIISFIGYIPQLKIIFFSKSDLANISLTTWMIWSSAWCISLGYGMTVMEDVMFCITACVNLSVHFIIMGVVAYKRVMYSRRASARVAAQYQ